MSSNEKLNELKSMNELTLSKNKESMELMNNELVEKIEELKVISKEYQDYKMDCSETLEKKTKEINELNNKVSNLEREIKMYKLKITSFTEEIDIWKENEKKLKETYGDLHYSLLVAQEENKNYLARLEENELKMKSYESKIKELKSNLNILVDNPETEINSSVLISGKKKK